MASQALRKEDLDFTSQSTTESFDWPTLLSSEMSQVPNMSADTNSIESPIIITSPQNRRVRIKETELEWWIGSVTGLEEDYFTGRLEDLSGNNILPEVYYIDIS